MADGDVTLKITPALAERLHKVAQAAGESLESFALSVLEEAADDNWAEELRRYEEYRTTGEFIDADTFVRDLREGLEVRLAAKGG
jgi:hypothetical protein